MPTRPDRLAVALGVLGALAACEPPGGEEWDPVGPLTIVEVGEGEVPPPDTGDTGQADVDHPDVLPPDEADRAAP